MTFSLHINNLVPYTVSAGYTLSNPNLSTSEFRADLKNGSTHQYNEIDALDYYRKVYINGGAVYRDVDPSYTY